MSRQSFELVQNNSNETHKVLTGKYENLLRRKALIRSEHGLSSAKRNGVFSCGWTFTYMSNEYKWSTAAFNRRWVLRDINDREIAEFTRASLAFKRIGKLEIYHEQTEPMDPEFVAMIVLSCKLVHNTAKANESRWSNG
ncbi:hypothetical protein EV178_005611 [Coemansia sp. RSA 1646]|nr:hypothetical protein EV178_005611 [Coemansia sp. RSA 1646]